MMACCMLLLSLFVADTSVLVAAFLPVPIRERRSSVLKPCWDGKVLFNRLHASMGNDEDHRQEEDESSTPPAQKPSNIWQKVFDPVVTSPLLPLFLFWGPIFQNPYNKMKWKQFTSATDPLIVNAGLTSLASLIVGYFIYSYRFEAAEEASERRELALRDLRLARQGQFSSNTNQQTSSDAVEAAAAEYEEALREELSLRVIIPDMWRLDFPDDPASREEDKAAARQFLGLEITDDGNIIEKGEPI